jgi:hypothetical protein
MTAASPFIGLGQRPGAKPFGETPADEIDDKPFIHRSIPAAGAPSVLPDQVIVSPFAMPWLSRGSAGASADQPAAEETTMAKKPAVPGAPIVRNLQQRVCAEIQKAESISRAGLAEALPDISGKQLSMTLFNIHTAQRAKKVKTPHGDEWQLTRHGRSWLASGKGRTSTHAPAPAAKAAAPAPAKRAKKAAAMAVKKAPKVKASRAIPGKKLRKARAAESGAFAEPTGTALALRPFEPVIERSFRCATFNDGAFVLHKNGVEIQLTAAEHAEMLRYEERMAEQPA